VLIGRNDAIYDKLVLLKGVLLKFRFEYFDWAKNSWRKASI